MSNSKALCRLGWGEIFAVESSSRSDVAHMVARLEGAWVCSCEAKGRCKHIDLVMEEVTPVSYPPLRVIREDRDA